MAPTYPTRVLAGVTVPDTELISKALEFVRQHSSDMTYGHVVRSWLYGAILGSRHPLITEYDAEIHAVSAILHDLAWDCSRKDFVSKDKRFEVDSADAARDFLKREAPDWDHQKQQLTWDAIALHTTQSIAFHKEAEVALTTLGIGSDLLGPDMTNGLLTQKEFDMVVKEFPRLNIREGLVDLMCQLCKTKPETTYDNWVGDIGVKYLEEYSRDGQRMVDLLPNIR
ncbi:hypothetical protein F5884DRAFT_748425 [Xylogone sp. PMI_703]|nr:hypothetical protein F5884DRAFT_748425 [Xylogone sp. PMI_703]